MDTMIDYGDRPAVSTENSIPLELAQGIVNYMGFYETFGKYATHQDDAGNIIVNNNFVDLVQDELAGQNIDMKKLDGAKTQFQEKYGEGTIEGAYLETHDNRIGSPEEVREMFENDLDSMIPEWLQKILVLSQFSREGMLDNRFLIEGDDKNPGDKWNMEAVRRHIIGAGVFKGVLGNDEIGKGQAKEIYYEISRIIKELNKEKPERTSDEVAKKEAAKEAQREEWYKRKGISSDWRNRL